MPITGKGDAPFRSSWITQLGLRKAHGLRGQSVVWATALGDFWFEAAAPSTDVTGTAAFSQGSADAAASGQLIFQASSNLSQRAASITAAGQIRFIGAVSFSQAPGAMAGQGSLWFTGSVSSQVMPGTISSTGQALNPITGNVSTQLKPGTITATGQTGNAITGNVSTQIKPGTLSAAGTVEELEEQPLPIYGRWIPIEPLARAIVGDVQSRLRPSRITALGRVASPIRGAGRIRNHAVVARATGIKLEQPSPALTLALLEITE
jgi:hypothetical protein